MRAAWVPILALGVGLRLLFLLLAPRLEPHADESTYIYLATCWNHFGVYTDWVRFLWPPGYTFFVSLFLRAGGVGGVFAAKAAQVLLSGAVGASVALLGARFLDRRATRIALWIWALYPPLIGYTHMLWPETLFLALFLPAFVLIAGRRGAAGTGDARLLAGGLLLGLALLVKEAGIPLAASILLWAALRGGRGTRREGLRGAALTALALVVVVLPWAIRNHSVYGRFQPIGATLGMNCYVGLNGSYRNLDYPADMTDHMMKVNRRMTGPLLGSPPPSWKRSEALNMIDRSREETAAGIRFALDHPGFILRTRVKRVADYLSPTSFFIRHYALGKYEGVPAMDGVRRPLLVAAILLPLLVLAGSVPGFFRLLRRGDGWILALLPAALFLSAGLLVGASRFRMPVVPILILLASGALAGGGERLRRTDRAAVFLGWAALLFFWAVNAAEVRALLGRVW